MQTWLALGVFFVYGRDGRSLRVLFNAAVSSHRLVPAAALATQAFAERKRRPGTGRRTAPTNMS